MNIYLENNTTIAKNDILAVLDRKTLLKSKDGRAFLESLKGKSFVYNIKSDVKTLILVENGNDMIVYGSDISSNSIKNKFNMKGLKI